MARRLFTLCSTLSLLLCVAVCLAWVVAQRSSGYLNRMVVNVDDAQDSQWTARFYRRSLVLTWMGTQWLGEEARSVPKMYLASGRVGWHWQPVPEPFDGDPSAATGSVWVKLGFRFGKLTVQRRQLRRESLTVALPYWLIALLAAMPPAAWLRQSLRRRRRIQAGLCASCGYDLRTGPDRCPECGTPAEEAKA